MKKLLAGVCTLFVLTACSHKAGTESGLSSHTSLDHAQACDALNHIGDRVFFEYDSSELSATAMETLKHQAEFMKHHGHLHFILEGHCDERGTKEYNMALGERRAHAVKKYLMSLGIHADKLKTVSFGKERPAVLGHDDSARAQNRRTVTVVK